MMKKLSLLIFSLLVLQTLSLAQALKPKDKDAILAIMERQENCWNTGELECFMNGYWESDSLKFIGSSGVSKGWQTTLNNYRRSYPDKAAMGTLTFTILSLDKMGKKSAFVIGKWHLEREAGDLKGHFSLNWRKIKGKWVIVADHSS